MRSAAQTVQAGCDPLPAPSISHPQAAFSFGTNGNGAVTSCRLDITAVLANATRVHAWYVLSDAPGVVHDTGGVDVPTGSAAWKTSIDLGYGASVALYPVTVTWQIEAWRIGQQPIDSPRTTTSAQKCIPVTPVH